MQRAVHVGDEAAADEERAVGAVAAGGSDATEPARACPVAARHGRDGVPREVAQVQHLPLDLARAAVEREREEPGRPEAQLPPLREEPGLVGEEHAPAAAHQPARVVGGDGQAEQAVERRVVGQARDQRRLLLLPRRRWLLLLVLWIRGGGGGGGEAEPGRELHLGVAELVDGGLLGGHPDATHAPR